MSDATIWEFLGRKLNFSTPHVMGILNVTPDSFHDGGKYKNESQILNQVEKMIAEGASIVDIGGYSTRPGATDVSINEEIKRTAGIIKLVTQAFPDLIVSIDTFRAEVAKIAVQNGASIINDVSGGTLDDNMYDTVAELGTPYVLMHMRGTPQTMDQFTEYDDLMSSLINYYTTRINELKKRGVKQIFIDPGFGFAKTMAQNYEIIKKLEVFNELKLPLLIGISRKSLIWKKLNILPENALNGTTALNALAISRGAKILRVHDVREAMETIKLVSEL